MLPLDVTPAQQARQDELRRRLSEPQRAALFSRRGHRSVEGCSVPAEETIPSPSGTAPGRQIARGLRTPQAALVREGGEQSAQQFRDVVQVLRVQGSALNAAYLDTWARKLDLVELLARARAALPAT